MNKGRNIAIGLLCLMCISLLGFLITLNKNNTTGVVDNVRYYLTETSDGVRQYDFYFVNAEKKSATVTANADETEYTVLIADYPYTYVISGTREKDAKISYYATDEAAAAGVQPYETFTEAFFRAMIFGAEPVLKMTEAIVVALIAACGGLVIGKSEELWGYFNKDVTKEFPEWEDMGKYRIAGGCLIGAAVVVLLLFVLF